MASRGRIERQLPVECFFKPLLEKVDCFPLALKTGFVLSDISAGTAGHCTWRYGKLTN